MLKRIINVLIWVLCCPLLFFSILGIAFISIYILFIYIVSGKEVDIEKVFIPMDFVIELPYKIIKYLWN